MQVSNTAAHGGVAVVHAGTVNYHAAPPGRVLWPHQVGTIPSAAQSFQHRAAVERLREALDGGGTAVLCQVLTGAGGVGKTQLAADYARRCLTTGETDLLVWITAVSRPAVVAGYAQVAVEILGADPADSAQAAGQFLAWLEPKAGAGRCRWLIVLDDIADPADLSGLWPPASTLGRTVATTRRRESALFGDGRRQVTVGLFTAQEAMAYLKSAMGTRGHDEPAQQLAGLANDLGHLPLALAQAAAHLLDAGISCARYRSLLADAANRLADLFPDRSGLPDDQVAAVSAAWSLSIKRADLLEPAGLARPMLQVISVLDPNGIPQAALTGASVLRRLTRYQAASDEPGSAGEITAQRAIKALRVLHRLSLIDHDPDSEPVSVRMHQLIQRTVRDPLADDERDELVRCAADALMEVWPQIERDTHLARALRGNAAALRGHPGAGLWAPGAHPVLSRAGMSLGESGQVAAATGYFGELARQSADCLGPEHPDSLLARHEAARWRGEAGDAAGAAADCEQLLASQVRALGPDHPHTLSTRFETARWRGESGDAAGAAAAFGQLVSDQVRAHGPDHPDTLSARHCLAHFQAETGDAQGAAAAFRQLLTDQVRVLGADHLHTLITRHEGARWQGEAGDAAAAAAAFERLIADDTRALGPDHPGTLHARHEGARWLGWAGHPAAAAAALKQLLADRTRVQGPEYPHTLMTRNDLARWQGEAGHPAAAAAALKHLLADQIRVLGPDHPHTLMTRHEAARWEGEAGDPAAAAAAFEQLLADRTRVLGPDHPHTLTTRASLSHWRGQAAAGHGPRR